MSLTLKTFKVREFMDKQLPKGDLGLMLSFGPGFSAQRILLKW